MNGGAGAGLDGGSVGPKANLWLRGTRRRDRGGGRRDWSMGRRDRGTGWRDRGSGGRGRGGREELGGGGLGHLYCLANHVHHHALRGAGRIVGGIGSHFQRVIPRRGGDPGLDDIDDRLVRRGVLVAAVERSVDPQFHAGDAVPAGGVRLHQDGTGLHLCAVERHVNPDAGGGRAGPVAAGERHDQQEQDIDRTKALHCTPPEFLFEGSARPFPSQKTLICYTLSLFRSPVKLRRVPQGGN